MADNTGYLAWTGLKKIVVTSMYPTMADFPSVGVSGTFYEDDSDGKVYRYISGAYVEVNPALDDNNNLVSITGLPQSTKPNNLGDPDYVAPELNTTECPLPTP